MQDKLRHLHEPLSEKNRAAINPERFKANSGVDTNANCRRAVPMLLTDQRAEIEIDISVIEAA